MYNTFWIAFSSLSALFSTRCNLTIYSSRIWSRIILSGKVSRLLSIETILAHSDKYYSRHSPRPISAITKYLVTRKARLNGKIGACSGESLKRLRAVLSDCVKLKAPFSAASIWLPWTPTCRDARAAWTYSGPPIDYFGERQLSRWNVGQ